METTMDPTMKYVNSMDSRWLAYVGNVMLNGDMICPRNIPCYELLHKTFKVPMWDCVLSLPERKLNYKFMAAEAYWILTGDDKVENIAPYNPYIAEYSDDGERFFGAYGPKIMNQVDYVVEALVKDINTRQAALTIWRENPPETKDVPCTISLVFQIRNGYLNCHAFMRSSDVWLGLPYDVFNFSMVASYVLARLKEIGAYCVVNLGDLYLTAASSHLYQSDLEKAQNILSVFGNNNPRQWFNHIPQELYNSVDGLMTTLEALRHTYPGHYMRWWERP